MENPSEQRHRFAWVLFPLLAFAVTRLAVFFVAHWSLRMSPYPGANFDLPALEGLCWWDCGWFVKLAERGYLEANESNFFPLFPLLGSALHSLTGLRTSVCLVVVANLASLGAYVVMYRLFLDLEGDRVAKLALVLYAAWPFSFFGATGYPESIMALSTAAAVLLAYRRRHVWAGAALGVGVLARHLTILGGAALLVAQLRERGRNPLRFVFHRAFVGLLLPFLVPCLYFGYLWHRFGDPLSWLHARTAGWGEAAWEGLWAYFRMADPHPKLGAYVILSLVPGAGAFLLLRKKEWWTMAGFALALMLTLWTIGLGGLGRYTGSCWPAFLPLAYLMEKKQPNLALPVICSFAMVQGLYIFLFAHSYPIN